jgi:type II secretory pathway component PulM
MKFNYDTLAPREQKMLKFGAIGLVAILIFGVMLPLNSSDH